MNISVIIPVFNESERIVPLIEYLQSIGNGLLKEIIVVDCDRNNSTLKVIKDREVIKIYSDRGRALQMNSGAKIASGDILLFLHADTAVPGNAFNRIYDVMKTGEYIGGAFSLGFDNKSLGYRLIAFMASVRTCLTRIPFGDQAVFLSGNLFKEIGGYSEIPLMEDVDLFKKIKRKGYKIKIIPERVRTSTRNWEKNGIIYSTLRNWSIQILYFFGVKPEILAKLYYKD